MNTPTLLHPIARRARSAAGFTLVEVMIAATIGSVIMAAVITTYIFSLRGFRAIENYTEIHSDGRIAVDYFARDMRAANDISSYNPSNIVVTIPTTFSSAGTITATKTVTYTVSGGAMRRTDSSTGKTSLLATNINTCAITLFDRVGSNTVVLSTAKGVQINLNLRKRVQGQVQSEDYLSGRLIMRNKK